MKIVFTGGGSGGHFYPLIAVAEEIRRIVAERRLIDPKIYFFSTEPYDQEALLKTGMTFVKVPAGKLRIYPSIKNFTDLFKTAGGFFKAFFKLFSIYPDVVFAKGGFASFPTLLSAVILGIPIIIHESDSVPGRVNQWMAKYAKKIAVSFPEAGQFFPKDKTAWVGQPIRRSLMKRNREEAFGFLKLDSSLPTVLVLGGSLGAEKINETVLASLSEVLRFCQVIHQTGEANINDVRSRLPVIVPGELLPRYHSFGYLDDEALAMSAGAADLVVSRAGSTIFEIAFWGLPSIVVPISESNGDHQRKNAYSFAGSGASIVLEENNFTKNILVNELQKIFNDSAKRIAMAGAASRFFKGEGARKIAEAVLEISISHES